jgi:hypothetical protein
MAKTVKILTLQNNVESLLLSEILNEKGIPHIIRSYHDSAYDGLWQSQLGWGHVDAPEEFRDEIIKIYATLASNNPE